MKKFTFLVILLVSAGCNTMSTRISALNHTVTVPTKVMNDVVVEVETAPGSRMFVEAGIMDLEVPWHWPLSQLVIISSVMNDTTYLTSTRLGMLWILQEQVTTKIYVSAGFQFLFDTTDRLYGTGGYSEAGVRVISDPFFAEAAIHHGWFTDRIGSRISILTPMLRFGICF